MLNTREDREENNNSQTLLPEMPTRREWNTSQRNPHLIPKDDPNLLWEISNRSCVDPFLKFWHVLSISISVQLSTSIYLESYWRLGNAHSCRCMQTTITFLEFIFTVQIHLHCYYSWFFALYFSIATMLSFQVYLH